MVHVRGKERRPLAEGEVTGDAAAAGAGLDVDVVGQSPGATAAGHQAEGRRHGGGDPVVFGAAHGVEHVDVDDLPRLAPPVEDGAGIGVAQHAHLAGAAGVEGVHLAADHRRLAQAHPVPGRQRPA